MALDFYLAEVERGDEESPQIGDREMNFPIGWAERRNITHRRCASCDISGGSRAPNERNERRLCTVEN